MTARLVYSASVAAVAEVGLLADAEHDRVPGGLGRRGQGVPHRLVALDRGLHVLPVGRDVAVVVLEVVHAPLRELQGVGVLVPVTAGEPAALRARRGAGVLVDAELEAERMHVVGDRLDAVRELGRVGHQVAAEVAVRLGPAVVDVHVLVAGRLHAIGHHGLGGLLDQLRADVAAERVPVVPAHRRRQGQAVVQRGGGRRPRHAQHGESG
jgi:hypothetical protein